MLTNAGEVTLELNLSQHSITPTHSQHYAGASVILPTGLY